MNRQPPISDEELHALVDGEADPRRRDAIFAFLSASPADAARVEGWRRQNEILRAAFAKAETEPVPLSIALATRKASSSSSCKLLAKAFEAPGSGLGPADQREDGAKERAGARAGLLLVAFICGALFAGGAILALNKLTVTDAVFSNGDLSPLWMQNNDVFADRVGAALRAFAWSRAGGPSAASVAPSAGDVGKLVLPLLSGAGLKLIGVRVAPSEFDQMSCMFYSKGGETLALCAESARGEASDFREIGRFPFGAIVWRQGRAKYAISGPLPGAELRALGEKASAEISGFQSR